MKLPITQKEWDIIDSQGNYIASCIDNNIARSVVSAVNKQNLEVKGLDSNLILSVGGVNLYFSVIDITPECILLYKLADTSGQYELVATVGNEMRESFLKYYKLTKE